MWRERLAARDESEYGWRMTARYWMTQAERDEFLEEFVGSLQPLEERPAGANEAELQ